MLTPGLVSVSFRPLTCEKIIEIAKSAGLRSVEWGGDIHVPAGDAARAADVYNKTAAAGLSVAAYGSYYKLGTHEDPAGEWRKVLQSAVALRAPVVRIWAGVNASQAVGEAARAALVREARSAADAAAVHGITVVFECHRNTLTDDWRSALRLLREIDRPNVKTYWQPNEDRDFADNQEALAALLPHVVNLHVFHWPQPDVRLPLSKGTDRWREYLSIAASDGKDRACLLEFMPDDRPETLPREAQTLLTLLEQQDPPVRKGGAFE